MLRLRQPNVEIMQSGHFVSRCSDYIIYSVEAKNIDAVVKAFGPCMMSPATHEN
jgi:prephenate dehydrogenase (NADP+)